MQPPEALDDIAGGQPEDSAQVVQRDEPELKVRLAAPCVRELLLRGDDPFAVVEAECACLRYPERLPRRRSFSTMKSPIASASMPLM
jgi:hypothetical protein